MSQRGVERGKFLLHHVVMNGENCFIMMDVNFLDYGVWDAVWMGIFSIMRI